MANFETDLEDIPFELEALVNDAIGQILSHEDPQLFVSWMREHIYDYYTGPEELPEGRFSELMARNSDQIVMDSDMARSLAANFASMIWNGVPLPSNLFRPRPMPTPKRNDRCHCGSGKKYKHCCARLPSLPSLSTNELWPIVYEKLDKDIAAGAIRENRVPLDALNMIAQDYLESEQPKKAVALLKPLFEGEVHKTNDDAEFALTLLCNAYDYLGHHRVKIAFLRAIIDTVRILAPSEFKRQLRSILIENELVADAPARGFAGPVAEGRPESTQHGPGIEESGLSQRSSRPRRPGRG